MNKRRFGVLALLPLTAVTIGLVAISSNTSFKKDDASANNYTLTLNSVNAYSGGSQQSITTDSGAYQVNFLYSGCSALNNYHALMSDGATITNKEHIRSVNTFKAQFEQGTLQAKTSYDGVTWGSYFDLVSNFSYQFSDVYFVSLKASGSVKLLEAKFTYSCLVNGDAHEGETGSGYYEEVTTELADFSGQYLLVHKTSSRAFDGGRSTLDANNNYISVSIDSTKGIKSTSTTDAASFIITKITGGYTIQTADGYYIGRSGSTNGLDASSTTQYVNTIDEDLKIMGSGGIALQYNVSASRFRYYASTQASIALYKLSAGPDIDTPKDEVGFTASDSNKNNYFDNTVFDTANGLSATVQYSDGTSKNLANNEYSYKIYNSSEEEIDTSVAFPEEGTYTLKVFYKSFIPVEIVLYVGEYYYLSQIEATMSNTSFTTDDILSYNLMGNLVANKIYSKPAHNVYNIAYNTFVANNLEVTLYNPSNVSYSVTSKFNVAGTWTVKITTSESSSVFTSIQLTVEAILATSVSLNTSSTEVKVGKTVDLVATVLPDNATDKTVTWESNAPSIASVNSSGKVTGLIAGSATITATANDGSGAHATCSVTVKASATLTASIMLTSSFSGTNTANVAKTDFATENITLNSISTSGVFGAGDNEERIRLASNNNPGSITFTFAEATIVGVKVYGEKYGTDSTSVKVTTSANTTGQSLSAGSSTSIEYTAFASDTTESTSLTVYCASKNRYYLHGVEITIEGGDPVYPTSISLNAGSTEIGVGKTTKLTVGYTPSSTNQKYVTYTSNHPEYASVDASGTVTGVAEGSATITARALKEDSSYASASVTITVTAQPLDAWTIMIYMCGSNLESGWSTETNSYQSTSYLASSDLDEIKSVSNQPDDVNIIVEAGGARRWKSSYSSVISAGKINRFHLRNGTYSADTTKQEGKFDNANMGASATFKSFLKWGLTEYPAQKTAVILWNHGGGMWGVCNDESNNNTYNMDSLEDDEVKNAIQGAFNETGTSKLEWIGYDACLMQLQDVAEFNSPYFNYMVGSQESEYGYGWDYDTWLDNLYDGDETETILTAIVDGFIADNGGVNAQGETYQGEYYPANQTLSFLNLNYMSAYKTAWENMAAQLKTKIQNTTNGGQAFRNLIGQVKYFAEDDYDYFCEFDSWHFIQKLKSSSFNPGTEYTTAVENAFNNLVVYSVSQKCDAKDAHGLSFFFSCGNSYGQKAYSTSTYSNFTNWNYISYTYGGAAAFTSTYTQS